MHPSSSLSSGDWDEQATLALGGSRAHSSSFASEPDDHHEHATTHPTPPRRSHTEAVHSSSSASPPRPRRHPASVPSSAPRRRSSAHDAFLVQGESSFYESSSVPSSPVNAASSSVPARDPSLVDVGVGRQQQSASRREDAETMSELAREFLAAAPLQLIRQHSFGCEEPMTARIDEDEDEDGEQTNEIAAVDVSQRSSAPLIQPETKPDAKKSTKRAAPRPRVFHVFLLQCLSGLFSIRDLGVSFIPVCRAWRKQGHLALAHSSRRMQTYIAVDGGGPLMREMRRLTTRTEIKRRVEAASAALQANQYARHRVEQLTSSQPTASSSAASDGLPQRSSLAGAHRLAPSVTLLQHVQFLPASQAPTVGARPFLARVKKLFRQYAASNAHVLTDADCLSLSSYLTHLRVLRIYDGSRITNEGIRHIALQLKHLRILHIGRLSDEFIDDRAMEYIGESLTELHSLWMTQDLAVPLPSILNPRPRTLYNLFTNSGLAKLVSLHATLHHLNVGGFRNLTHAGLRLLSTGTPRLQLHSLHMNGLHITDECVTLLQSAHSATLYHLHLFDVGISNAGLVTLAQVPSLETLILDHVQEVDEHALELFVDEAMAQLKSAADEAAEADDSRRSSTPPPAGVHLTHLELHSCARLLTQAGVLHLALHPTLRWLTVSGPCLASDAIGAPTPSRRREWTTDGGCRRTLAQLEELSGGRIRCNGGITPEKKAAPAASSAATPAGKPRTSTNCPVQ